LSQGFGLDVIDVIVKTRHIQSVVLENGQIHLYKLSGVGISLSHVSATEPYHMLVNLRQDGNPICLSLD
jgi:hypothetical protein